MNEVKVNKAQLLSVMGKNLAKHKEDIKELLEERRTQLTEYFEGAVSKMARDKNYQPAGKNFPLPEDKSESYERAIRMAEMSVDEELTLSQNEFHQLVLDNWHWKHDLLTTSAFYGKAMK